MYNQQQQQQSAGGETEMRVRKRDGALEVIAFDKILARVKTLGARAPAAASINYTALVMKVIDQLFDGISTCKIDEIMARECASLVSSHPDFHLLAGRLIVSNHHKKTSAYSFGALVEVLARAGVLAPAFAETVRAHRDALEAMCDDSRDFLLDYFGFTTLEKSYLLRCRVDSEEFMERPQHMFLRVAVAMHGADLARVRETYDGMSQKRFIHATPTLFNAGTRYQQLSSCYLLGMEADSVEGIFNTIKDAALISKWSGGIGLHIHDVRATGGRIEGTNGRSSGIVPMLRVFNQTAKYINQGGKRNGSVAVYLEPWHLDVELFLQMRKNHGEEELKARDLFYGLWIPDLFMRRVKSDGDWTLFCPRAYPGLADVHGPAFDELYARHERAARGGEGEGEGGGGGGSGSEGEGARHKVVKARELWFAILDAQMETGTPYLCYKDACNRKSNQQNLGTIRSSNLCSEIIQYSDASETAVCNLASVALPAFVRAEEDGSGARFDLLGLRATVRTVVRNLNRVIDINFYPTEKTRTSNLRHRPVGVGVQGLADVFMQLGLSFTSPEARQLNREIFEHIYFAALSESCELARIAGEPYASFAGSPASEGRLQFDLWREEAAAAAAAGAAAQEEEDEGLSIPNEDWNDLRARVRRYGLRNSLLVAPMPTASTSQILGFNECVEPITSNLFSRRTLAGEFILVNRYLVRDLLGMGLWNEQLKNDIVLHNGSVQHLVQLPAAMREKYRTVWEMSMRGVIDMAADRGRFVCQSQSLNLWMEDPNYQALTAMHFHAWSRGLKTGIYYLRRRARHQAQKFSVQAVATDCLTCSA